MIEPRPSEPIDLGASSVTKASSRPERVKVGNGVGRSDIVWRC